MKNRILVTDARSGVTQSITPDAGLSQGATDFTPFPDEVARRAYFTYLNEGAPQGRHVQHWLDAEAQLIQERNRTRIHGFHKQP
jgi:hypothetical protein